MFFSPSIFLSLIYKSWGMLTILLMTSVSLEKKNRNFLGKVFWRVLGAKNSQKLKERNKLWRRRRGGKNEHRHKLNQHQEWTRDDEDAALLSLESFPRITLEISREIPSGKKWTAKWDSKDEQQGIQWLKKRMKERKREGGESQVSWFQTGWKIRAIEGLEWEAGRNEMESEKERHIQITWRGRQRCENEREVLLTSSFAVFFIDNTLSTSISFPREVPSLSPFFSPLTGTTSLERGRSVMLEDSQSMQTTVQTKWEYNVYFVPSLWTQSS